MRTATKRIKHIKKGLLLLFILVGLSIILLILLYAPVFDISVIEVAGNTKYTASEIRKNAELSIGENCFRKLKLTPKSILEMRLTDSEESINGLPYIKDSQVTIVFPNKISILITERNAEAFISYLDNFLIVDREGYVLEVADKRPTSNIKEIRGIEFIKYSIGGQLKESDTDLIKIAVEIIDAVKSSDKNSQLKLFEVLDFIDMVDKNNALLSLDSRVFAQFNPVDKLQYTIDFTKEIFFKKLNSKETGRIVFSEGQNPSFIPQ